MKKLVILLTATLFSALLCRGADPEKHAYPFNDPSLSFEARVDNLISLMTLEEKVMQMMYTAPSIDRLGVPAYNWWNECLHGVGRSGDKVTVFPQAIGMAATFDAEALRLMGSITADEARAIYNEANRTGKQGDQYKGLTFWTPNINIFRDPRWGRGQETYGEDPYLTGVMGMYIVNGLQGDDPRYLKASACAKHFAVHSGPETSRHVFDTKVDGFDLWDTYLAAFRDLVVTAKVSSVMCAYNRYDGQPCCGSDLLLGDILRNKWGFTGYVTSDCGAIDDFFKHHKTHPDAATASADAVIKTTDLDCGRVYEALVDAVSKGYITEQQIDASLARLFMTRMRLGMFDTDGRVPYDRISYDILESDLHKAHALKMAEESIVLLKNSDNTLPLAKKSGIIAVVGPNADDENVQLGNYNGFPSDIVTPLEAIRKNAGKNIIYVKGLDHTKLADGVKDIQSIVDAVKSAETVIFVGGISPRLEGEEGDAGNDNIEGFKGGDRTSIALPQVQTALMKALKAAGKRVVFVNMSGSAMAFPWEAENVDAIVQAWYGGQSAGTALANVLYGDCNPSGCLPVTFYASDSDLSDFNDYSMAGRTYRFFDGEPLYPFGYGLSYTTFEYSDVDMSKSATAGENVRVKVSVKNTGDRSGEHVVQLYLRHGADVPHAPKHALKGFKRVNLAAGESREVEFLLTPRELAMYNVAGELWQHPGDIEVFIGGGQPDASSAKGTISVKGDFQVK